MATEALEPGQALTDAFVDLHPGEAAELLESASVGEIAGFLGEQTAVRAGALLERMSEHLGAGLVLRVKADLLRRVVDELNPWKAALLFSRLPEDERAQRLKLLEAGKAAEIDELISYPPDSAGHLMETQVHTFRPEVSARDTLARLRRTREGDVDDVLVVDEDGRLLGLLTLAEVALGGQARRLEQLIEGPSVRVQVMAPKDEIVELLASGGINTLPVVDVYDRLLGVIRHDALMQAVKEEVTADLATLVGASKDELALSPALFAVRKRLPWLNINLLTAFAAASVVGLFESTIAQFTALAVLLPVVAGQSGNTGAQALAVVIRGLALREIRARQWPPVLLKEALVGAINGISIAVVTAIAVYVWSQSLGLCLVIVLAMILSMVIAGVSGAAIPLVLVAIRQDPAQSGSIILTTVTDIMGFFSFLGLATVFSNLL